MKFCKNRVMIIFLAILFYISIDSVHALSGLTRVKEIEFRGLHYLSKYEIIDEVKTGLDGEIIVINVDSLKRVLRKLPIIKNFNIIVEGERLIISIVEVEPVFLLAFTKGNKIVPFELDKEFRIISVNNVHASGKPLIIISGEDILDQKISLRLKSFLSLLKRISDNNLSVYEEIEEIDLTNFVSVKIILKGRRTIFTIRPLEEYFYKLNLAVGYFDSKRHYPDSFQIMLTAGLFK